MEELKDLLATIARALVDEQDAVTVHVVTGGVTVMFELTTAKRDVGKVIGREGKTADAIRTILGAVAARHRLRCNLEIIGNRVPVPD